ASTGQTQWIIFVVRDDAAPADIVYELPTTTWEAYNYWGGKSLYHGYLADGDVAAYQVSYDRPYHDDSGAGQFFEGDYSAIRWLESQGYNVTYVTSTDLNTRPNVLSGRKLFMSTHHDEYWSRPMRTNLTAARDAGMGLAFYSANDIYWQIRFGSDSHAAPDRTITCYKDAARDPIADRSLTTVNWRSSPVNQPENELLGGMYGAVIDNVYPWVVTNAGDWVYDGANVTDGDLIAGL